MWLVSGLKNKIVLDASIGCAIDKPVAGPGNVFSQHQAVRTRAVLFSVVLFWISVEAA